MHPHQTSLAGFLKEQATDRRDFHIEQTKELRNHDRERAKLLAGCPTKQCRQDVKYWDKQFKEKLADQKKAFQDEQKAERDAFFATHPGKHKPTSAERRLARFDRRQAEALKDLQNTCAVTGAPNCPVQITNLESAQAAERERFIQSLEAPHHHHHKG